MGLYSSILLGLLGLQALCHVAHSTRLRGNWKYDQGNRLKYLTKFGVQDNHEVFVYGTVYRTKGDHVALKPLTLAFVPSSTWGHFFTKEDNTRSFCNDSMYFPFNSSHAPDPRCSGPDDFYRNVPCNYQHECRNQFGPLVPGGNTTFTFRITSPTSQYYYLFLVGCYQNAANTSLPCQWFPSQDISIDYNIHIVNQDPELTPEPNPFVYEFSYQLIGMMIIYILFSCIYFTVTFFHLLMHSCLCTPHNYKHHRLTVIFTVSLFLEMLHVLCVMTHYCVFSEDGVGVLPIFYIGQILNFLSDWLLILVLLLIGKGWQITTATVRWKKVTLVVWLTYILVSAIFFVWIVIKEVLFPFSTHQKDIYQSWASGLYLAYRLLLLLYILWEMRQIYLIENRRFKLRLYLVLVILYIMWFCYLPIAVIAASVLNVLERARIIVACVLTFDLIMNIVMVLLMCPKWSQQYFQFSSHLNTLVRVTMRRMKDGLTQYRTVSNSFTSDDY